MASAALSIHSLVEAHLYAALLGCRECSARGFLVTDHSVPAGPTLEAHAVCDACGAQRRLVFDVSGCPPEDRAAACVQRLPFVINRAAAASHVIDVAQWLTLYRMAVDAAGYPQDRKLVRAGLIEAGLCLREALRFYAPDSELPPPSAFYAATSLERMREDPAHFLRPRIVELLAALPTAATDPPAPVVLRRPVSTKWWLP